MKYFTKSTFSPPASFTNSSIPLLSKLYLALQLGVSGVDGDGKTHIGHDSEYGPQSSAGFVTSALPSGAFWYTPSGKHSTYSIISIASLPNVSFVCCSSRTDAPYNRAPASFNCFAASASLRSIRFAGRTEVRNTTTFFSSPRLYPRQKQEMKAKARAQPRTRSQSPLFYSMIHHYCYCYCYLRRRRLSRRIGIRTTRTRHGKMILVCWSSICELFSGRRKKRRGSGG